MLWCYYYSGEPSHDESRCLCGSFAQPGGMSDFPQTWVTEYDLKAGLPTACESNFARESIAHA